MSDEYARVHTTWEFELLRKTDDFSDGEFETIKEAIAEWAKENLITPYQLLKTDRGFEVTIGTFCHTGARGMAQGLFLTLARQVFRKMEKSILYREKEKLNQ